MSMFVQDPSIKCPYCGREMAFDAGYRTLSTEKTVREIKVCPAEDGGCGRDFVISGSIKIDFPHKCLKIEGQES